MIPLYAYLKKLSERESGQTMAEYAVILAVITAGIIAVLVALSSNIQTVLDRISAAIQ